MPHRKVSFGFFYATLDSRLNGKLIYFTRLRALQAAAQDLARQRTTDSLKKGLENRPTRDDLIERKLVTTILGLLRF